MTHQQEAWIHLSEKRSSIQRPKFRSLCTLFAANEDNVLGKIHDETLGMGESTSHVVGDNMVGVLIPMVGGCRVRQDDASTSFIDVGSIKLFSKGSVQITNPFVNELINYLYLELPIAISDSKHIQFDLVDDHGRLLSVYQSETSIHLRIAIGKFNGREEVAHHTSGRHVMVYCLEGVFEVQGCLLHARDGLTLINAPKVDFEALSNSSILLVIEQ